MKIKVGDTVKVIAGQDKNKTGKVIKTIRNKNKVVVEGINVHKRNTKPNQVNQQGGIFEFEAPIQVSNVKKIDAKEAKVKKEAKKEVKEAKTSKTSKKKAS